MVLILYYNFNNIAREIDKFFYRGDIHH